MQVETFEMETASGDMFASDEEKAELVALAKELALTGQQEILETPTGDVFPYRPMTTEEKAIYSTLLPRRTEVERFKDEPIPLRVMQVIAHCRSLNDERVQYLEIWHQPAFKDPLLVGRKNSYSEPYILARWGDVLMGLAELRKLARQKLLPEAEAWATKIKQIAADLPASTDARVEAYLNGAEDNWKVESYKFS